MTLADFKRRGCDDRCGLRRIFEQASTVLTPLELVRLAEYLEQIKPCSIIDKSGHRRQVEPRFKLRPKDRRAMALRLLAAGVDERRARRLVTLSRSTWWRIRNEGATETPKTALVHRLNKRRFVSKRTAQVGEPGRAVQGLRTAQRGSAESDPQQPLEVRRRAA